MKNNDEIKFGLSFNDVLNVDIIFIFSFKITIFSIIDITQYILLSYSWKIISISLSL